MPDVTVFMSSQGVAFDHLPEKQQREATAALTAAHEARVVTANADATLIASLPPHELAALRMFHVNDTATLAAAWRATLEFRNGRAERERRASEAQQRASESTPPMICLTLGRR